MKKITAKSKRHTIRKSQKQMRLAGAVGVICLVFVVGCSTSRRSQAMALYKNILEPNIDIPAILLELDDTGEPGEIENIIIYTIAAINQDSVPNTNIVATCQIPIAATNPSTPAKNGKSLITVPVRSASAG